MIGCQDGKMGSYKEKIGYDKVNDRKAIETIKRDSHMFRYMLASCTQLLRLNVLPNRMMYAFQTVANSLFIHSIVTKRWLRIRITRSVESDSCITTFYTLYTSSNPHSGTHSHIQAHFLSHPHKIYATWSRRACEARCIVYELRKETSGRFVSHENATGKKNNCEPIEKLDSVAIHRN